MALVPLIGRLRGLNTATLKQLPLSLAPKSYCGEVPVCVVQQHKTSMSPRELASTESIGRWKKSHPGLLVILPTCF